MYTLEQLGWHTFFEDTLTEQERSRLARITVTGQNTYQALTLEGKINLKLTGSFSRTITTKFELPAVGDWVVTDETKQVIHRRLPRQTNFVRNIPGEKDERQVVAANIEEVWLVMSLNKDFNLKRLNRYVTTAWDSGAIPVIVLTKSDLVTDLEDYLSQVESEHMGIEIIACSALNGAGFDRLNKRLVEHRTIALVGSSGADKSTLLNYLAGEEIQTTSGIRDDDSRGRHTTTSRFLLPVGDAWIIDTPGMRELQLWADSESLDTTFTDIKELTANCRFNNCTHNNEPGCAVTAALADGTLSTQRWAEYTKLQKELAYLERKANPVSQRQYMKAIIKKYKKK
ncbi:putative ribosome biogenesis GTPase RsgA 2 [Brochothrix thermosphacta]|uniref:ribosome small subunit-dependent GTPase A n=1 Tax=Brochothrix thermosphacta TaxID=2756 RepID=UPI000D0E5262|nr:ribosome small subunit-dependent GTPase A [Brochothrix thermosphacta]SOC29640.1 putative ribosome biogenesis GTPase RsgA 2 [Brochothrix thermosphacta]